MNKRTPSPKRFAALVYTAILGTLLTTSAASASSDIFSVLGGPEDNVSLRTWKRKDGSLGTQKMFTTKEGGLSRFVADGRTTLRSPKINLDADLLEYDGIGQFLTATGDVTVEQGGVKTSSQHLRYDFTTGVIELTGSPAVEQNAPSGISRFTGMEVFRLIRKESGSMDITMTGGEEILCEMLPPAPLPEGATPTPTPTPNSDTTTQPAGGGLMGLGSTIRIRTSPRLEEAASVMASTTPEGALEGFLASGSVILESDQINLRSNQLEYKPTESLVEARNNVYIKQETIEAECQKMTYNLDTNKIRLLGNPEIREQRPTGLFQISNMAEYIITRAADGSIATETIAGPDGPIDTQLIGKPNTPTNTPPPVEEDEGEIRLDSPEDINKLGPSR